MDARWYLDKKQLRVYYHCHFNVLLVAIPYALEYIEEGLGVEFAFGILWHMPRGVRTIKISEIDERERLRKVAVVASTRPQVRRMETHEGRGQTRTGLGGEPKQARMTLSQN